MMSNPRVREWLRRIEEGLRAVGEILTPRERTELTDILEALPPGCEVKEARKVGVIRRRLQLVLECGGEGGRIGDPTIRLLMGRK